MNEIHIIIYESERTVQKQPETPSEIIKAARDKSDLTVEELTDRVGITERYLYRIENEGKVPTFEVLKKIVRELAIDGNLIFLPREAVQRLCEMRRLCEKLPCSGYRSRKIYSGFSKVHFLYALCEAVSA